jgi:lysine 2,3-aminomutase
LIQNQIKRNWELVFSQKIADTSNLKKFIKINLKLREEINEVTQRYPMSINPYYLNLIQKENGPIWNQCIPNINEIINIEGNEDPLKENKYSPIKGLVHRYPDRVLLLVSNRCAMYCRFCTRKRMVGKEDSFLNEKDFLLALEYIESHEEIRDVIISGGDPLLLDDEKLEYYISSVKKLNHVEMIRIDSRTPCTLPQRITPELCKILKKYPPIYFLTHFNHPMEITTEAKKACEMLADSGIVMGNQSVLLKGVNDDSKTLIELGQELLKIRVRPYYIYMPDEVKGTSHFKIPLKRALNIMEEMYGFTSGLAVPRFIIDLANGGGKIPITPNYLIKKDSNKYIFKNFEGKYFTYNDI